MIPSRGQIINSAAIRERFVFVLSQRLEWLTNDLAKELFAASVLNGDQASL